MGYKICSKCGAPLERGKECIEYFNQMLAWDFADFKVAGRIHHLTVLCYYLQHPKKYSREGLKESLKMLQDIVESKLSVEELYKKQSNVFSSEKRDWHVEGTEENHGEYSRNIKWSMTAADIIKSGVTTYPKRVEEWSKAIYEELRKSGDIHD
jgi:uncharacterized protein DUF5946